MERLYAYVSKEIKEQLPALKEKLKCASISDMIEELLQFQIDAHLHNKFKIMTEEITAGSELNPILPAVDHNPVVESEFSSIQSKIAELRAPKPKMHEDHEGNTYNEEEWARFRKQEIAAGRWNID